MPVLDSFFIFGSGLMAAATPISIAVVSLTFFPMVSVWLLGGRWTLKRWPPRWGKTEKAFGVFFLASLASALHSPVPGHSLHEILKDLYIFISVLLVALIDSREKARRLLLLFLIAGVVSAAWGIFQFAGRANETDTHNGQIIYEPPWMSHWPRSLVDEFSMVGGRAHGTRSHPLTYAESLLFLLAFAGSYLTEPGRKGRLRWCAAAVLFALALLASLSRGPWIAAALMGVLLLAIRRSARALAWVALGAGVCGILLLHAPVLRARLATLRDRHFESNYERLHMWRTAFTLWKESPLLGIGPGNSRVRSEPYQTPEERSGGGWGHFHSNFVNILAERGAVGLAGFFFFFTTLLWELALAYRQAPTAETRSLYLAALLGVAGFLMSGATETSYNDTKILMMLYFVTGIAFAWSRRLSHSE